jgi:hypothetical protein
MTKDPSKTPANPRILMTNGASLAAVRDLGGAGYCRVVVFIGILLAGLTVLLLWIGVYPSPFLDTIEVILAPAQ